MVPTPGAEASRTWPPDWRMKSRTIASPRPVPRPTSLVVKNGSNTRARTSSVMPLPVSDTETATNGPATVGSSAMSPGTGARDGSRR